jgi:hypothetical protein
MHRYLTWNAPAPTTAALASTSTGTAIKTMLQLATPSTRQVQLISWGFALDDPPGADAVIELIQTDVAATGGTAHVASGLISLDPNLPPSLLTLGTGATGYAFTTEGVITATRALDVKSISSTSAEAAPILNYSYQWMPDERPIIAVSKFLRVRATTPTTAVDMRCWVCWDE